MCRWSKSKLMRFGVGVAAVVGVVGAAAAQKPCPDPLYPPCTAPDSNPKIPEPPAVPEWTAWVEQHANPNYPIPSTPPARKPTAWGGGANSKDGKVWGQPGHLATELCACGPGKWSITIDDGPVGLTPEFLDLFRKYNVTGTFFSIGGNIVASDQHKADLRAAYAAGHQIAIHSWTHRYNTMQATPVFISEVVNTALAIYRTIGKVPRYYRPPYGDIDDRIRNILLAFGIRAVVWNVESLDTEFGGSQTPAKAMSTFQHAMTSGYADGLRWVPPVPLTGKEPYTYGGFISLEHELSQDQYDFAAQVVPVVTQKYTSASVADCDSNDGARYFKDGEAFLEFIKGLAGDVATVNTTGAAPAGLNANMTAGGFLSGNATVASTAANITTAAISAVTVTVTSARSSSSSYDASLSNSLSPATETSSSSTSGNATSSNATSGGDDRLAMPSTKIAIIAVGVLVGIFAILAAVFAVVARRRARKAAADTAASHGGATDSSIGDSQGEDGRGEGGHDRFGLPFQQ